jgi:glyoxylase-like metal-dependent hydrolase (beta-lactamase superfamily II)
MKNWNTKTGCSIIQVSRGRRNAYRILKDKKIMLVDTGKKSEFKTLAKNIESIEVSDDDVKYLILTQSHFDHCLLAKLMK